MVTIEDRNRLLRFFTDYNVVHTNCSYEEFAKQFQPENGWIFGIEMREIYEYFNPSEVY